MRWPVAGTVIAMLLAPAAQAQTLTPEQAVTLQNKILKIAAERANELCLNGTDETREHKFSLSITDLINSVTSGLSLNDRKKVIHGAIGVPDAVRVAENNNIRDCLRTQSMRIQQQLVAAGGRLPQPAAAANGVPNVIDLKFTYRRSASLDRKRYNDNLRLNLQEGGAYVNDALAPQLAPDGSPYFHRLYYPYPSGRVVGAITASPLDSRLTADQAPKAEICLERPTPLPGKKVEEDYFDCVEGGVCKGSTHTTGWLRQCTKSASLWQELSPISRAWAQPAPARRWITPSLDTLSARVPDGVGWSYFKLRTDALRRQEIRAVEVALAVNGTAVEEDGLAPRERPVPNDPSEPFDYLFALQTLDFHGAEAGCDRVSVTLTPRLADGSRGSPQRFNLMYAALRDQLTRTEQGGDFQLQWSATVIRPIREWRHWPFVQSYSFRYGDETSREVAAAAAEQDRRWLDQAGLIYQGAAVRGVVRPPMRVEKGDGTTAYGLTVGLLQPNGQIRFTFSEGEARKLGQWMITHRADSTRAARVINPKPYLYQAPSGAVTPAGICTRA